MTEKLPSEIIKQLRRGQTDAERIIWERLRNRQLGGYKFRRQQPIGRYVVDFVCFERKLIIELDGGQHNRPESKERDGSRTEWLKEQGYRVVRFWNNDIIKNAEGVLDTIHSFLNSNSHPHLTSPLKGEE